MKITFWGTRGTYPVPGAETHRYGGNTPCIELRTHDGTLLILDAGTGIRPLGRTLFKEAFAKGQGEAFLLLSHTHWDHVQGFPFFGPAFIKGNRFHIFAPRQEIGLREIFLELTYEPYFPVPLDGMGGSFDFHEVQVGDAFSCGSAKVSCVTMHHPWRVVGYRIEDQGVVIAYLPNTAIHAKDETELSASLVKAAKGADLLICDSTLTAGEAAQGWCGHASAEQALSLAQRAKAKRLALFHYAPERTDEEIDSLQAALRKKARGVQIDAAFEGWTFQVERGS